MDTGERNPLDRARVAMEVVWLSLGTILLAELMLSLGWLGFRGEIAGLRAWQLMILVLAQNLLAVVSIMLFLRLEGKSLGYLGFGRGAAREAVLGLLLLPAVMIFAVLVQLILLKLFPALHNVEVNPILSTIRGPWDAAILLVASTLAGGIGEETVRAFVLRRFQTHLGGIRVGLVIWSLAFGAMHLTQGMDKAIVVGMLGFLFGLLYVWRRSPVAAMVVHGGFNAIQTLIAYLLGAA